MATSLKELEKTPDISLNDRDEATWFARYAPTYGFDQSTFFSQYG